MELQLALALPGNSNVLSKGFDLNSYGYEPKGLFGPSAGSPIDPVKKRKCSFDDDAFVMHNLQIPQTLPLLVWNNNNNSEPIEEEDHETNYSYDQLDANSITINTNNDGEENGVIGWPPVSSWRKKLCNQRHGGDVGGGGGGCGGGSKSMYVKVKMEGEGIARKVDLSQYQSYETLILALVGMFGKCGHENVIKLTYQDKEGDWLLAGDVPWGTFVRTVQRLKLLKMAID